MRLKRSKFPRHLINCSKRCPVEGGVFTVFGTAENVRLLGSSSEGWMVGEPGCLYGGVKKVAGLVQSADDMNFNAWGELDTFLAL